MKKLLILILLLSCIGCSKKEINYMDVDWSLDNELKPTFEFERSKKNDVYGIFYVDNQIEFSKFIEYIKSLKEKNYEIDWRYSDVDSIDKIEEQYQNKESTDNIFKDEYINIRMCKDNLCFFMQWVNKDAYNTLNKDNPTSYSFKLETENKNNSM